MIIRLQTTEQQIPLSHIVLSDLQKGREAIRGVAFIHRPVGVIEEVVKSFWTVLSHDIK